MAVHTAIQHLYECDFTTISPSFIDETSICNSLDFEYAENEGSSLFHQLLDVANVRHHTPAIKVTSSRQVHCCSLPEQVSIELSGCN